MVTIFNLSVSAWLVTSLRLVGISWTIPIATVHAIRGNATTTPLSKLQNNAGYFEYSGGHGVRAKRHEPDPSYYLENYPYSYEDVSVAYTTVDSPAWPADTIWRRDLESVLSPSAKLISNMAIINNSQKNTYTKFCIDDIDSFEMRGVCMIAQPECRFRFCGLDGKTVLNLPAYTVDVRTPDDIIAALTFAAKHNIQVSVKTTGHNFVGSSTMSDSINIWMAHYPKDGTIKADFRNSCGQRFTTVGIHGGEIWDDVFQAVRGRYHVVSGDTRTVSAAGGWLQGVGLSHTCRKYGLGVDNVVSFDVVLPEGRQVTADLCQNTDLFWALRGGGGGTFGVVTHVEYKLHPKTSVTEVIFQISVKTAASTRAFLKYWAKATPFLDNRVGGAYFTADGFGLFIVGDEEVALEVFLDDFRAWFEGTFIPLGFHGTWFFDVHDSWYSAMGGSSSFDRVPQGGDGPGASTRLIPHDMVVRNPNKIVEFLVDLDVQAAYWGAYWIGGAVNDVRANATAVHPVMRKSIWAITTTNVKGAKLVRSFLPNTISGCSFNHQSGSEPNWRISLWGKDHYNRLLGIKNRYDPSRRLNCWHCVGYQGVEYEQN